MNELRRNVVIALASVPFLGPLRAFAQGQPPYLELNPPQPVEAADKIEVLEFFAYTCIHCYNLEPKLETWLKKLPKDVEFRRVPAVFSQRGASDASIFYAFEALGLLPKLHLPYFEAIHVQRLRTGGWPEFSAWLEQQGIDAKKFETVMKSFGVQTKARRAARLTVDYKIDATPTMAVHGRYTVPGNEAIFDTVNRLVATVRKNQK